MLKVIIAEDEPKVALLIKNLIDWDGLGMELSGMAKNGSEALDMIRRSDPDVIITDIRMPVTGGLELITEAKEIKPVLEFIIISGYKHFDYAHSALKSGVSDYLLKPINQDELNSTLEKVKGRIISRESAMDEQERVRRIESDLERGKRLELFAGIDGIGDSDDNGDGGKFSSLTAEVLNRDYCYHFTDDCCYRFLILKIDGAYSEIYSEGLPVLTGKIREAYVRTLSPLCCDIEMEFFDSRATILLGFPAQNKQALRDSLKDVFDDVRIDNNIIPSAVFTMTGGMITDEPPGLHASWQSAKWALSERLLLGAGSFYENLPVRESSQDVTMAVNAASKGLAQAMDVMDCESAARVLSEASDSMSGLSGLTGNDVLRFAMSVYDEWLILCQRYDPSFADPGKQRGGFLKKLEILSSAAEVYACLESTIRDAMKTIIENLGQISGRPVSNAKRYIKEHFRENITINNIAFEEGFNVSYFSTLFKKETGQTFSEYLTGVRMDEARRLLKETNLSIALVCESVGYSDTKHFTATFRKITGIKPSEYRKLYSWGR